MKKKKDRKKRASSLQYGATPEDREIIARIAEYRRGPNPLSYSEIAQNLNEEGIPPLRSKAWHFKLVEYYFKQGGTCAERAGKSGMKGANAVRRKRRTANDIEKKTTPAKREEPLSSKISGRSEPPCRVSSMRYACSAEKYRH